MSVLLVLQNILYVVLAMLGLGLLVFIHELGHYLMAKKVGMRVEVFSIGFGKTLVSWKRGEVVWKICLLPFGGYVKIAGMDKQGDLEPHEVKDGYFGKKPIDRIKVSIMGPAVNIVFAFLAFLLLWGIGGREKPFSEYTHKIGWLDTASQLYKNEVRPGDEIVKYNNKPFAGMEEILKNAVMKQDSIQISGEKIDYLADKKTDFDYSLKTFPDENYASALQSTIGILAPASYLINVSDDDNFSYAKQIKPFDRLIWVDGEIVFSQPQLKNILNTSSTFLTIKRANQYFQVKLPRVKVDELHVNEYDKDEIDDWKHELYLKDKLSDLYFIPYYFNENGVIEEKINFIDERETQKWASLLQRNYYNIELQRNDQIVAVNGAKVANAYDILRHLQTRKALVIVQRDPSLLKTKVLWRDADDNFDALLRIDAIKKITTEIGVESFTTRSDLTLLEPIELKTLGDLAEKAGMSILAYTGWDKAMEKIKNPEQRKQIMNALEKQKNDYVLGVQLQGRKIIYNPNPFVLFKNVFVSIYEIFKSLVTGSLSPKWLSGPVGIIFVSQHSWSLGIKEALFWLGFISLNLGILNLLPIPVLDGGHIIFSIVEMVTKKPIKAKTMERIIIPFMVLLILAFIYVTYHDLSRLFMRFFQ